MKRGRLLPGIDYGIKLFEPNISWSTKLIGAIPGLRNLFLHQITIHVTMMNDSNEPVIGVFEDKWVSNRFIRRLTTGKLITVEFAFPCESMCQFVPAGLVFNIEDTNKHIFRIGCIGCCTFESNRSYPYTNCPKQTFIGVDGHGRVKLDDTFRYGHWYRLAANVTVENNLD